MEIVPLEAAVIGSAGVFRHLVLKILPHEFGPAVLPRLAGQAHFRQVEAVIAGRLFVQGVLALHNAAGCDNETAGRMFVAMDELNQLALEHADRVDEPLWTERLRRLSAADDRNPLLSGYACAILLERGLLANDELVREVSRRLSPGVPADLGAGWFEGLSRRNRA